MKIKRVVEIIAWNASYAVMKKNEFKWKARDSGMICATNRDWYQSKVIAAKGYNVRKNPKEKAILTS